MHKHTHMKRKTNLKLKSKCGKVVALFKRGRGGQVNKYDDVTEQLRNPLLDLTSIQKSFILNHLTKRIRSVFRSA